MPIPRHPHPLRRLLVALTLAGVYAQPLVADSTPRTLPFAQDWSNTGLITTHNDWSGVPGIMGYRGDNGAQATGVDPQTLLLDLSGVINVTANAGQTLLDNTSAAGGVAEFAIANPVLGLSGSGTADAPNIVIHLNTTGQQDIHVAYLLRDLDGTTDNAVQPVALQYRVGAAGNFINVPAGFVADATSGPNAATQTTAVSASLPAGASNQALVQVRILTTNAVGNDEWIGIDDILLTGTPLGGQVNLPIVTSCPAGLSLATAEAGSLTLSATDADSVVNAASITAGARAGISLSGFATAMADGETASVSLDVANLAAGSYPVSITFSNNEAQTATCTVNVTVSGITTIPAIQGSGSASPLVGQTVTTRGVVTKVIADYGYFIQDLHGDGNPATSDGLFVYSPSVPAVAVAGNLLRLSGLVGEFQTLTELVNPSGVTRVSGGHALTPERVEFPEAMEGDLEKYEGMLIQIDTPLTVSQNYFQGRYGEITLSSHGRLEKPTNRHVAGTPEALQMAADNARRRITLDDGSSAQNPNPIPFIGADNTLRAGDSVHGLTGVLHYGAVSPSMRDYKLHPSVAPVISRDHPRTAAPAAVGGNFRVAGFNVLNYFTTFVDGNTASGQSGQGCALGGNVSASNCRGANNLIEFHRQRDKIVSAIRAIDADVVGLMEIQNNANIAAQNLVDSLNTAMGAGTYASVGLPASGTGDDAIRVALIYKPARLVLVGGALGDPDSVHNRPPLAQTFAAANGEKFSVVVNHFKSKGSCPASGADADQGDGQGCWNALRTRQAQALRAFIDTLKTNSGDDDVLVIGDLNAYGKEDPVLDFTDNGYVDQIARFDNFGYSYVFDGEAGYLDHALATPSLSARITGAYVWHINADEPSVIDYNTEFKSQDLYAANPYRSSDHDPVIVGLNLVRNLSGTAGRDVLLGTPGDDVILGGHGADTLTGDGGRDRFVYASPRDALDLITDFKPGMDSIDLRDLLRNLGITGASPLSSGHVVCGASGLQAVLSIDPDGSAGAAPPRPLIRLNQVGCGALMQPGNFMF